MIPNTKNTLKKMLHIEMKRVGIPISLQLFYYSVSSVKVIRSKYLSCILDAPLPTSLIQFRAMFLHREKHLCATIFCVLYFVLIVFCICYSSSAENPFPHNCNVKELTAKILQYTGRQTPPMPEYAPSNNGARYRPILSTTTIHDIADRSASHQEADTLLSIKQRPIPPPLDLHKHSGFKYYVSEMSGSPTYANLNMSSPSSVIHSGNMEISPPNRGNYYSSSVYSPRTPSNLTTSNSDPYSLVSTNYSSSNYIPSTFTPSPSPWFSQLDSNSPRFKFPTSSGNIAFSCSPSVCSQDMFDENLSPISPNKNNQIFFPSNFQGSDKRGFPGKFLSEAIGSFDQRPQIKSEIVSRPTFDFDRIMETDSLYSFAGQKSPGLASGYSGNVCPQEVDTFGVRGLLEKANDNTELRFFEKSILPSEDRKDEDVLLNFMKRYNSTNSDEDYNIWGFPSNTGLGEDAK